MPANVVFLRLTSSGASVVRWETILFKIAVIFPKSKLKYIIADF